MARKPLFPKQPLEKVDGDPSPGNGPGQMSAVLDAGVEMLTKNRGDITPIIQAAKAAKESIS